MGKPRVPNMCMIDSIFSLSQVDYNVFVADISRDVTSQQLIVSLVSFETVVVCMYQHRSSFSKTTSLSDMLKVVVCVLVVTGSIN